MIRLNEIPQKATPIFDQLLVEQNPDALWEDWIPASTQEFIDEIFHVPSEEDEGDPQPEDIARPEEAHIEDAGEDGQLVYLDNLPAVTEQYDLPTVPIPTSSTYPVVRSLHDKRHSA